MQFIVHGMNTNEKVLPWAYLEYFRRECKHFHMSNPCHSHDVNKSHSASTTTICVTQWMSRRQVWFLKDIDVDNLQYHIDVLYSLLKFIVLQISQMPISSTSSLGRTLLLTTTNVVFKRLPNVLHNVFMHLSHSQRQCKHEHL